MNLIKKFRNPYFAISASIFMLFFSCSQYEIRNEVIERAVDFSIYDSYKNGEIKLFEYKRSDKKLSNLNVYDDAT